MDTPLIRSQVLTSERKRLRVNIETQQSPIWRRRLHDSAGMAARAQCPIHIAPPGVRLQRVYNLFVKYRSVRRVVHVATTLVVLSRERLKPLLRGITSGKIERSKALVVRLDILQLIHLQVPV